MDMILGRLGRMAYVNTLPVDWGLVRSPLGKLVTVHRGTPTVLNRMMAQGQLDVSAVSSVEAARHADDWLVMDHLCIGCRDAVGSVILHSERPVEELDGSTIAVTNASATAVKLLEVLLSGHWKVRASLEPQAHPQGPRLLIGDAALKTAQSEPTGFVYDLGSAWRQYTGGDFVFGLWCVRREYARDFPQQTRALYHLLKTSRELGRAECDDVVVEAASVTGLSETTIREYFPKLVYDLDDRLWDGLTAFLRLLGFKPNCLEKYGVEDSRMTARVPDSGLSLPRGAVAQT